MRMFRNALHSTGRRTSSSRFDDVVIDIDDMDGNIPPLFALCLLLEEKIMATDKHEQIRQRAHEIWENEGRPEGSHLRHWLQAADELEGENEHETLQDLLDEDDRDDAALLQGAGESGDFDKPREKTVNRKMKTTEGS